jgi:general secretion pathway protein D
MLEIVKFIDQPLVAMEEVNVRAIHFAKAEDIKKRLEELVAESQKQTAAKDEVKANTSGSPGITRTTGITSSFSSRPLPPGLTRLGAQAQAAATPNETLETLVSDADRGMIRGKVQIIADERTNQLIIITRADNMAFFERIITVLDVETAPDVKVEVQRMEYADAEEVSTMLNDLIGNVTSKKDDKSAPKGTTKSTGTSGSASGSTPGAAPDQTSRSTSLAEAVAARANRNNESSAADSTKSKLGQLSKENIKILADKRTNAIIMMGSIGDLAAVKEIIKGMDIQLSQVLIETVVLQVELGKDLQTGLDWVAGTAGNSYTLNHTDKLAGGGGSGSTLLQSLTGIEASTAAVSVVSSGVNYFLKSDKLNISALITAAQSDDRTKVLSSPVLLTVDNKEASIEATSMRYLYKGVRTSGTSSYGYTEVPDYEQRDIGLTVKVTPRISPNGMVVLTIDEKFETIGANQTVGTESYPTVNTRKVAADVSVNNMQTVILGGLVQNEIKTGNSGIPLLKDIPWVGKYLFGKTSLEESRSELLIFLTPYVLTNAVEAQAEAQRRKDTMHDDKPWSDGGWSKSQLADPVSAKEKLDRARKVWATEDEERDAEKTSEKLFRARRELMLKQTRQDADEDARREKIDEVPSAGPSVGAMKTTESVQVIRPSAAPKPAPAENTPPPVAPEPEPSKKSWWWLF